MKEGLRPLPRLLGLQRNEADLTGQRGQLIEKIAQTELNSGETDLQIINQKNQFLNDVLKDTTDVRDKRLRSAEPHSGRARRAEPLFADRARRRHGRFAVGAHQRRGHPSRRNGDGNRAARTTSSKSKRMCVPQDADDVYVGQAAKVSLGAYQAAPPSDDQRAR